jgi:hypothetical protein
MTPANETSTLDTAPPANANRKIRIFSISLLVRVGPFGFGLLVGQLRFIRHPLLQLHKVNKGYLFGLGAESKPASHS